MANKHLHKSISSIIDTNPTLSPIFKIGGLNHTARINNSTGGAATAVK